MANHVRRPDVGLARRRFGVQQRRMLSPGTGQLGGGGVGEAALVQRASGLGVGDAEQMPDAIVAADEAVVVDVPGLGLAL